MDLPQPPTLYDPAFEHDACGVGLVCRIDGEESHEVVRRALAILCRLDHRGAVGADPETGDGAGILIQSPDALLRRSVDLPDRGDYAVAALFLDPDPGPALRREAEEVFLAAGLPLLGWRRVPTNAAVLGATAGAAEPETWQALVGRPSNVERGLPFLRRLYVARRRLERVHGVYVCSCSPDTLVYKGMLKVGQLASYYPDLTDPEMASAAALVHSRFSTNTLPRWPLAQPFRYLCHNGEINTLRGNANWMQAREGLFGPTAFGGDLPDILGVLDRSGSDSQQLDQALELLLMTGRSLPQALMMLVPEAWESDAGMPQSRRAFYEHAASLMEPWDGPAGLLFCDGRHAGAMLDRNGLRPGRYTVTHDGYLILGSEAGTLDLDPANVRENGRLRPGQMLLVDLEAGRLVENDEVKRSVSEGRPYSDWVSSTHRHLDELPDSAGPAPEPGELAPLWRRFGYTREALDTLLAPMGATGKEATGSMGRDVPLAALSDQPRPLFDYFHQLFAQVTNPPIDAIREELVTSLRCVLGASEDLFVEGPGPDRICLDGPVLTQDGWLRLRGQEPVQVLPCGFNASGGGAALRAAVERLCRRAEEAVRRGSSVIALSDQDLSEGDSVLPGLLAVGAVHHHLIRAGLRMRCSLVSVSGEVREVHHACTLIGFGASAVYPWLALHTVRESGGGGEELVGALEKGILKVMSKMGISTIQSYCGAQVFEAVGLSPEVVDACFVGTPSRIGGAGWEDIARTYATYEADREVREGGIFRWRRDGERHALEPLVVARLQESVRTGSAERYAEFARLVNEGSARRNTLRGLMDFVVADPIPVEDVEPWTAIVKRFKTGAMSYGSISEEAHTTLARAMNRIGAKSNTGEGGEQPERYRRGNEARSAIKQVASGRFGVTIGYLASADEIQIKMAQGAKPGEGGQLPGEKVYPWIARTRHATPWVGLISPPPHHDIYSIEDLAQLIFDLRNANPDARISVKLVATPGVGTIAAGVAKAGADVVLISGHDGGTGAAAKTSILHAGLPWEMGLSETHQTLVRNGLRRRIVVESDGGLRTGRDVLVAALLGADEFGFATIPLVAMGCVMMRKCHLNTCPVGIATQNPELRKRFHGEPEHVVNYLHFVAEEVRALLASLGLRSLAEARGRSDLLTQCSDGGVGLDLSRLLAPAQPHGVLGSYDVPATGTRLPVSLDDALIRAAAPALKRGKRVEIDGRVNNTHRTVGTRLSHAIVKAAGPDGLPPDRVTVRLRGTAGQSFGAFGAAGLTLRLTGQANDYFGKGLSGAHIVVAPPPEAGFRPHEQIVVGNVALYGATSGLVLIRGRAGERFAVRNSGANAVVEGVGDHGCEYMTGGRVVVLGPTGRNFAAGMSGGVAYVLDGTRDFRSGRCAQTGIDLEPLTDPRDQRELRELVVLHHAETRSSVAAWVLENWTAALEEFVKVIPVEYREALRKLDAPFSDARTVAA